MALAPGTLLDGYEILAPLGSGGMGDVYRARDPILKREVAIKILPTSVSQDPDRLRRFEQEAQAAAALNHPNILAIHRFGVFEGAPYLVSELLEGSTLRQVEERGPLSTRKAIETGVQIAHGLAAAHEKGIVHRDLKPENLFVTKDGRVKILDFGLAKLTQPRAFPASDGPTQAAGTEPGVVLGTVGYMAPEQVRGLATDHRTDIFAFGAVLYEMLSGKRAFQRSTSADTMAAILNDDPQSISQIAQTIPAGLQRVVHRCLEKNPEQRFQSASDLAFALEALSESGISSSVAVATPTRKARRWIAPTAGAIALIAIAAVACFFLKPKQKLPFEHYTIQKLIDSKHVNMIAISPDGNYLAAVLRNADGYQDLWLHHIATGSERPLVQEHTYLYRDVRFSPDGSYIYFRIDALDAPANDHEDLYRIPVLGGQAIRVLTHVDNRVTFIERDDRICFYREDHKADTYQFLSAALDGSDEKVLRTGKKPFFYEPACSPDGRSAVFSEPGSIQALDFTSGVASSLPAFKGFFGAGFLTWRPDGTALFGIAAPEDRHNVQMISLSYPAGKVQPLTNDLAQYEGVSIAMDAKTIATTTYERNARFAQLSLANPSELIEKQMGPIEWFSWLNNGMIIVADNENVPRIVDLTKNEPVALNAGKVQFLFNPALCGPDSIVVSGMISTKSINVYRLHPDGSGLIKLTNGGGDSFPECTADGKWLFYVDNHDSADPYLMRQPVSGGPAQRLMSASVWYDLSPDGKSLALINYDSEPRLQILSTDSVHETASFYVPKDIHPIIAFSPDNNSIFYTSATGGTSTVWRQSLKGGPPAKVTTLPAGSFAVWLRPSPDGKELGLTLASPTSEAVLIHETP